MILHLFFSPRMCVITGILWRHDSAKSAVLLKAVTRAFSSATANSRIFNVK